MKKFFLENPEILVWQNDSKREYISSYSSRITGKNLGAYYVEGGSASIDDATAKNKAVFEAVERYSGSKIPKFLKKYIYAEVCNRAINPKDFIFYDDTQYLKSGFPYAKYKPTHLIEWVEGVSLLNLKRVFIPAFAVYLGYNQSISHSNKYFPTPSSGLAVHKTKREAIASAIAELIERDTAIKVWLNKLSAPIVDISTTRSPRLKELVSNVYKEGLKVTILLSSQELPVPSFIGIVYSEKDITPVVTFGLSAGVDIERTIQKSLEEALMVRCSLEYMKQTYGEKVFRKRQKQVRSFFDHSLYYSSPDKRNCWGFMLNGKSITISQIKMKFSVQKVAYDRLVDILRKFRYDTYIVNLTSDIAKEMKLYCVKVIIPKLRQMEIDHNFRFLKYGGATDKEKLSKSGPHPYA